MTTTKEPQIDVKELTNLIGYNEVILFGSELYIDCAFGSFYIVASINEFTLDQSEYVSISDLSLDATYEEEELTISDEEKEIILNTIIKNA